MKRKKTRGQIVYSGGVLLLTAAALIASVLVWDHTVPTPEPPIDAGHFWVATVYFLFPVLISEWFLALDAGYFGNRVRRTLPRTAYHAAEATVSLSVIALTWYRIFRTSLPVLPPWEPHQDDGWRWVIAVLLAGRISYALVVWLVGLYERPAKRRRKKKRTVPGHAETAAEMRISGT